MNHRLFARLSRGSLAAVALWAAASSAYAWGNASIVVHVGPVPSYYGYAGPSPYHSYAPPVVVHHRVPPRHTPVVRPGAHHVWVPGHWETVRHPRAGYRPPHGKPRDMRIAAPVQSGRRLEVREVHRSYGPPPRPHERNGRYHRR